MSWGLVAVGVGTAVAGYMGSESQKDAAKDIGKSTEQGISAELQMFREGQEATAPWRQAGEAALGGLSSIYGLDPSYYSQDAKDYREQTGKYDPALLAEGEEPLPAPYEGTGQTDQYAQFEGMQDRLRQGFETSPGQEYQLAEAEKAAKRQLSAGGFSGSGAEMKELQRIAQGQASQEWGNYLGQFGDYTNALRSMAGQGQTSAGQTASQATAVGGDLASQYAAQGAANAQSTINQASTWGNVIGQGAQAFGMYQGQQSQQPTGAYAPQQQPMAQAYGTNMSGIA